MITQERKIEILNAYLKEEEGIITYNDEERQWILLLIKVLDKSDMFWNILSN